MSLKAVVRGEEGNGEVEINEHNIERFVFPLAVYTPDTFNHGCMLLNRDGFVALKEALLTPTYGNDGQKHECGAVRNPTLASLLFYCQEAIKWYDRQPQS